MKLSLIESKIILFDYLGWKKREQVYGSFGKIKNILNILVEYKILLQDVIYQKLIDLENYKDISWREKASCWENS